MGYILLLLITLSLAAMFNGMQDHIMFYRTHIGKHPYRDFWHICKYIVMLTLILSGIILEKIISFLGFKTFLLFVPLITLHYIFKFFAFIGPPDKFYNVDETFKIRTGCKWLDKILGLHY